MSSRRGGELLGRVMAASFVLGAVVLLAFGVVELVGGGELNPLPIFVLPVVVVGLVEVIARVMPPPPRDGNTAARREALRR